MDQVKNLCNQKSETGTNNKQYKLSYSEEIQKQEK